MLPKHLSGSLSRAKQKILYHSTDIMLLVTKKMVVLSHANAENYHLWDYGKEWVVLRMWAFSNGRKKKCLAQSDWAWNPAPCLYQRNIPRDPSGSTRILLQTIAQPQNCQLVVSEWLRSFFDFNSCSLIVILANVVIIGLGLTGTGALFNLSQKHPNLKVVALEGECALLQIIWVYLFFA